MPKPIYSLHSDSVSVQGFDRPRAGADALSCWFKLDGKLYCAFLGTAKTIVAVLEHSDLRPVAYLPTETIRAAWGEPIAWGGSVCWMERLEDGTTYMYRFNGVDLRCDEVAGIPGVKLPFDPAMEALQLVPHNQKLLILPSGSACYPGDKTGSVTVRACQIELTVTEDEVTAVVGNYFDGADTLNVAVDGDRVLNAVISSTYIDGELYFFTVAGDMSGPGMNRNLRRLSDAKVAIKEAVGTSVVVDSKFVKETWGLVGGSLLGELEQSDIVDFEYPRFLTVDEVTFSAPSSLGFMPGYGFGVSAEMDGGMVVRVHWMKTATGVAAVVLGRDKRAGSNDAPPAMLVEFVKGQIKSRKLAPVSVKGSCTCYDPTDNSVNLIFNDGENVKLVKYNLSNGGVAPAVVIREAHDVYPGSFIAYEDGEPDARITSLTFNAETGEVDLELNLVNAVYELEYTKGAKWLKADKILRRDGGVTHKLRQEEPSYIGPIQYRLIVRRA